MDYDKPFEIQRQRTAVDDAGGVSAAWETIHRGFAAWQSLGSSEFWAAAAVGHEQSVKAICRWAPALDEVDTRECRLVDWRGRAYDITGIDNTRFRDREVVIRAERRAGDG